MFVLHGEELEGEKVRNVHTLLWSAVQRDDDLPGLTGCGETAPFAFLSARMCINSRSIHRQHQFIDLLIIGHGVLVGERCPSCLSAAPSL